MNKLNAKNYFTIADFLRHCLLSFKDEVSAELDSIEYECRFGRMKIHVNVFFHGYFKDEITGKIDSLPCRMKFYTLITKDMEDVTKIPCYPTISEIGDVKMSNMSDEMRWKSIKNMLNPFKDSEGGVYNETEEKETQSPQLLQNE